MDLQQLGNEATSAVQNQYPSLQILRDALVKKFSTNNPLIQQRQSALSNFLSSPEEAMEKYAQPQNVTIGGGQVPAPGQNPVGEQVTVPNVYLSPLQQRSLYSRHVANKFAPLSTLNDLLQLQSGGIEQVLSQANRGMESDIKAKQQKFDVAKALEELRLKSRGLDIQEAKVSKASKKEANLKQESLNDLKEIKDNIANARIKLLAGGYGAAGLFGGLRKILPQGWPGAFSSKSSELDASLGSVNKSVFKTAGKAFTKTEAGLLGGRIPKGFYDKVAITAALDELERDANARELLITSGGYIPGQEETLQTDTTEDDFTPDL